MRRLAATAATAGTLCLGMAVPAVAQEHPLTQPSRDVMVEYHVESKEAGPQRPRDVRMYFTDQGNKMRVEGSGQPGYAVMDRGAGRMMVVMPEQRMYMEMPLDPKRMMGFDSKDGTFTRHGTDTVAGYTCNVYDAQTERHSGQVCITDDGVMLRARSNDNNEGGNLEATKVVYGSQQASLFAPPAGYQKFEAASMPHGMQGMPPGGRPPR